MHHLNSLQHPVYKNQHFKFITPISFEEKYIEKQAPKTPEAQSYDGMLPRWRWPTGLGDVGVAAWRRRRRREAGEGPLRSDNRGRGLTTGLIPRLQAPRE